MKKGFTLIELMIVVAIIAIIAAIAIPNLLESRKAANESSAIGTLRSVFSAEQQFKLLKKNGNNYGSFTELSSNELFKLPNAGANSGAKSGYVFRLNISAAGTNFSCTATPSTLDEGTRGFGVYSGGNIYYTTNGNEASTTDIPLD